MAEKFLTTGRKKLIATGGLLITGWHAVTMGSNPLNAPALPMWVSDPLIGGVSVLTVAGVAALFTIWMIWTEY